MPLPLPYDREISSRSVPRFSRRSRYGVFLLAGFCVFLVYLVLPGPRNFTIHHRPLFDVDVGRETAPYLPPYDPEKALWHSRAESVKAAFVSAYTAYEEHAWPHDELKPLSNGVNDNLNGWGATLIDSLDTMILMGLDDILDRSMAHVAKLDLKQNQFVQFFETVIRYLGGFLSAYALTDQPLFLARADDLGRQLLPAFNTTTGLPPFNVNMRSGMTMSGWMGNVAILSEAASCQMEYRYLAHLTGRPEYVKVVDDITDFLHKHEEHGGLFPLTFSLNTGQPASHTYSVGAQADSAYEYLLKEWIMTGRTESKFLDLYLRSADAIINHVLYLSPSRHLLFASDLTRINLQAIGNFQHLSCFLAGLFALGTMTIPNLDERHAWAAEGLAHTCWITYADSATGLGPENMMFMDGSGKKWVDELAEWEAAGRPGENPPGVNEAVPVQPGQETEYTPVDTRYLLRPETIESFYLMWRATGDAKWRERGWAMFEAIEKHAKVGKAYASVKDVNEIPAPHEDDLPSFFFAETLKYMYLLFLDKDPIPLDKWTFNTEAHPIPIFTWSDWEKDLFNIKTP